MIYLDIIMTDKENCNDITPIVNHKAFLLKDVIKKPKLSLWDLYKLKKQIEIGYERLTNEQIKDAQVQASAKSDGKEMDSTGQVATGSTAKL